MIEKLRELEKAATPGPWVEVDEYLVWSIQTPDRLQIARLPCAETNRDPHLIATTRNLLPELLDVVEAAENIMSRTGFHRASGNIIVEAGYTQLLVDALDAVKAKAREVMDV